MYLITDYGASGDGKTLNTKAIQAAIDACSAAGGGTVNVPAGLFITGTIWLRDNVDLRLESGAILKGSPDLDDYNTLDAFPQNWKCPDEEWNGSHLILAVEVNNVSISGYGVIDGNGPAFFAKAEPFSSSCWRYGLALAKDKERLRPGQLIYFCECRHVRVENVSLRDATCWTCLMHGCEDVLIRGVRIHNPPYAGNTDGIDIDSSRNVTISDCIIDTGDDAITLRGDPANLKKKDRVCENVVVTNCILSSSSSVFRIGVGNGVIRNAIISNIIICRGSIGVHIQSTYSPDSTGVSISNITLRDLTISNTFSPFEISPGVSKTTTAQIKNIAFDGFRGSVYGNGRIAGSPASRPRNISLCNVDLTVMPSPTEYRPGGALLTVRSVDSVSFRNVHVAWSCETTTCNKTLETSDVPGFKLADDCVLDPPPGNR